MSWRFLQDGLAYFFLDIENTQTFDGFMNKFFEKNKCLNYFPFVYVLDFA